MMSCMTDADRWACMIWCTALWLGACAEPSKPSSDLLADRYPCDRGIAGDRDVVWAENFEATSVSAVTARYDDFKNPSGMTLVADRPSQSCGTASMRLTAGGSAGDATDLYKKLVQANGSGYDELYVRWYVKYQGGASWHHSGVWVGGYNPASNWPNPQAGTRPAGDDRVSFAVEPVWGSGAPSPRFDFYNYWMKMHTCSSCGGAYWGNALVSRNLFTADDNVWACMEMHVSLNTDMASAAGAALEVWKNEALIQRFPESGTPGNWVQDHYCPYSADGSQCNFSPSAAGPLDLQFRSSAALQLNHFWPQNYITATTAGSLWFDDMVVAKTRIGCLRNS
jgi:hypothetical protein